MRIVDLRFPSLPSAAYPKFVFYIYIWIVLVGSFGWLLGETGGPITVNHHEAVCSDFSTYTGNCRRDQDGTVFPPGKGFRLYAPAIGIETDSRFLQEGVINRAHLLTFQSGDNVPTLAQSQIPAHGGQQRASPPIKSFGGQLLKNFKGLFSKHNLKPLLIGSAATGLASIADDEVQEYFGETRRFKALGDVGAVVGSSLVLGGFSGAMLLWGYNTESDRFRSFGFSLAQGFVVNAGMTAGIKALIPRTRPNGENRHSFPSGHTSGAFTTAVIVAHYYGKLAIPAYVTAGLVGLSRLEMNQHFLSDVVAGATLGIIVGRTVCRQTDLFRVGPITLMPTVLPEGGVAVTASLVRQE